MVKAKGEVEEVDTFQVIGDQGVRGGLSGRRRSYGGRRYVPNSGRGGNRSRGVSDVRYFDPQACYVCRK